MTESRIINISGCFVLRIFKLQYNVSRQNIHILLKSDWSCIVVKLTLFTMKSGNYWWICKVISRMFLEKYSHWENSSGYSWINWFWNYHLDNISLRFINLTKLVWSDFCRMKNWQNYKNFCMWIFRMLQIIVLVLR